MRPNVRILLSCAVSIIGLTACDDPTRALSPDRDTQSVEQDGGKGVALAMRGTLRSYPEHVLADFETKFSVGLPDGVRPVSYEWTFDDGEHAVGANVSHTFADSGTHELHVKVTDQSGQVRVIGQTVAVSASIAQLGTVLTGIVPGGLHTCAINSAHTLYCWGYNGRGNAGDNTTTDRLSPTPVLSAVSFAEVATGQSHSCALSLTGLVYCWGQNSTGQLGDGTTTTRLVPTLVPGNATFVSISVGWTHTCALKADSTAYCWGANDLGQLGNGGVGTLQLSPVAVSGNRKYTMLRAGYDNTCGIIASGAAYCWGGNDVGQIGNGTGGLATDFVNVPSLVSGGLAFVAIGTGWGHACGLLANGSGYCWGWNSFGQLGVASASTCSGTLPCSKIPLLIPASGYTATAIAVGETHTCAINAVGQTACWGYNASGQVGDGTRINRPAPTVVLTPVAMKSIRGGGSFTCGVGIDNKAYCWGSNARGKLGLGDTVDRLTPTLVPGLTF